MGGRFSVVLFPVTFRTRRQRPLALVPFAAVWPAGRSRMLRRAGQAVVRWRGEQTPGRRWERHQRRRRWFWQFETGENGLRRVRLARSGIHRRLETIEIFNFKIIFYLNCFRDLRIRSKLRWRDSLAAALSSGGTCYPKRNWLKTDCGPWWRWFLCFRPSSESSPSDGATGPELVVFGDGLVSSIRASCNGLIAGTACLSTKQSRRIRPTIKRIEKLSVSILCLSNVPNSSGSVAGESGRDNWTGKDLAVRPLRRWCNNCRWFAPVARDCASAPWPLRLTCREIDYITNWVERMQKGTYLKVRTQPSDLQW